MGLSVCNSLNCRAEVILTDATGAVVPSACCPPINLASIHGKSRAEVESVIGQPDDLFPNGPCLAYYLGGGLAVGYTGRNPVATILTIYPENLLLNAAAILTFLGLSRMSVGAFSGGDFVTWANDPNYGLVTALGDPENPGKVLSIDILGYSA